MSIDEKDMQELKKMVSEIYYVVVGSEHDKETGLIERVKTLEVEQDKQKNFINRITWICVGMGMPAGWGVVEIIIKLFKL
jgi:hypothetical protein